MAAFLDKEPEARKQSAISLAKKTGFEIEDVDINKSGSQWEVEGNVLVQPLNSIKGLGDKAIEQIMQHRPFNSVEDLLFNEEIAYSKLNKKALSSLVLSGALDKLIDDRFNNRKHFWAACVEDRPKNRKKLAENIEAFDTLDDFTKQERANHICSLTGMFPFDLILSQQTIDRLEANKIPPLGNYDKILKVAWFIPREVIKRKTKNGKDFWVIKTTDNTSTSLEIRCWGVTPYDKIDINTHYIAKLDYNDNWGFSTRSIQKTFRKV